MEGWKCEVFAHGHWMPCKFLEDFGETLSVELKDSGLAQSFYAVGATFRVPKERFRFQKDRYGHLALESLYKIFPPQVCKQIVSFVGDSENVNLHDVAVRIRNKVFGCTEFYMKMFKHPETLYISNFKLEHLPRFFPNLVYFLPEFEQCKVQYQGVNECMIPFTSPIGYTGTAIVVASNFDVGCAKLRWEMVATNQKLQFLVFQPHFINGVIINFYDDSDNPDEPVFRIAVNPTTNALHLCMDRAPIKSNSINPDGTIRFRTVVSGFGFKELLHSETSMLTANYLAHAWKCFLALEEEAYERRFVKLRESLERRKLPLALASQLPQYALKELEQAFSSCGNSTEEPIVSSWRSWLSSFVTTSFSKRLCPDVSTSKGTLDQKTYRRLYGGAVDSDHIRTIEHANLFLY